MAGVVREYAPHASIVGETSFGKGTVQSLWDYADGSSIKITTAQWLYGNSQTSIDHKGIVPDYEVVDDPTTKLDEVMEWVRRKW